VNLTAVYSRELDGRPLTLAPTGWTYDNTFVLYDRESGTLWYPYRNGLEGIQGIHAGRKLKKLPARDLRWKDWVKQHPETKILR
jgi:Protein of unknown function (DUF3179)